MNAARHPRYIKSFASTLLVNNDPASLLLLEALVTGGINPAHALKTMDGDSVRLIAIDSGHAFPLVGEIVDYHAQTSWLARWAITGRYGSSSAAAVERHSIHPNDFEAPFKRAAGDVYTGEKAIEAAKSAIDEGLTPKHPQAVESGPAVPRFLLKEPANDARPPASIGVEQCRKTIEYYSAMGCSELPRLAGDLRRHVKYFEDLFKGGKIAYEELVYCLGALYCLNGNLEVRGPIERLTVAHLEPNLELLLSGQAKRAIVLLPGYRQQQQEQAA